MRESANLQPDSEHPKSENQTEPDLETTEDVLRQSPLAGGQLSMPSPPDEPGKGRLRPIHILQMQRTLGNQFVLRQLQLKGPSTASPDKPNLETTGDGTPDTLDDMAADGPAIPPIVPPSGNDTREIADVDAPAAVADIPEGFLPGDDNATSPTGGDPAEMTAADALAPIDDIPEETLPDGDNVASLFAAHDDFTPPTNDLPRLDISAMTPSDTLSDNNAGDGMDIPALDAYAIDGPDSTLSGADLTDMATGDLSAVPNAMGDIMPTPVPDQGPVVQRWTFRGIVSSVADTLSSTAKGALDGITSRVEGVTDGLRSGWDGLKSMASGAMDTVWQGLEAAGSQMSTMATSALDGIQAGWSALQDTTRSLAQSVTTRIQGALEAVTGGIGAIGSAIVNLDAAQLQAAWEQMKGLVGGVWQRAQEWSSGLLDRVGGLWNSLGDRFSAIGETLSNLAEAAVDRLRGMAESVRDRVSSAWETLQSRAAQLGGIAAGVMRIIQTVVNRLISAARGIWNGIQNAWSAVQRGISRAYTAIQSRVSSLMQRLRAGAQALWGRITGFFRRLRTWVGRLMQRALHGVQRVWDGITKFDISGVIESILRYAPFLQAAQEAAQNPDSVMEPMAQAVASQIEGGMPQTAEQKAREHAAGSGGSPGTNEVVPMGGPALAMAGADTPVQRSPDDAVIQRVAMSQPLDQDILWTGFWHVLVEKWNSASVLEVVKEALWTLIWPWPAVGREWDGMVTDLKRVWGRMTSAGMGFWRHLIDLPLIIWRRVNNILLHLYGWFLIASVLVGAIAGAVGGTVGGAILSFMAGGAGAVPGAGVGAVGGAGIGLGFALGVGEGLLASFVAAEGLSLLKAYLDLSLVDQTTDEQSEDLNQMANSAIGIAVAGILFAISAIAARIARGFLARLTSVRWQRFAEGVRTGFRGGSPFRRGRRPAVREEGPPVDEEGPVRDGDDVEPVPEERPLEEVPVEERPPERVPDEGEAPERPAPRNRELGLRDDAVQAIERMENIKEDPLGPVNRESGHNHYSAARREAAGEVVARRADGRPYNHIRDLQEAYNGLQRVRRTLEAEISNPPDTMTGRGLDVLLERHAEVQRLLSRLQGFLDQIGHGPPCPPFHEWPPGI